MRTWRLSRKIARFSRPLLNLHHERGGAATRRGHHQSHHAQSDVYPAQEQIHTRRSVLVGRVGAGQWLVPASPASSPHRWENGVVYALGSVSGLGGGVKGEMLFQLDRLNTPALEPLSVTWTG